MSSTTCAITLSRNDRKSCSANLSVSFKQFGTSRFNSLDPGKFEWNFTHVIFKQILVINSWGISCETALLWMSLDFTDEQSTLVRVMACCRQATSHYLSQCWPRSMSPNGVTRPQWVNHPKHKTQHSHRRWNTIYCHWLRQHVIITAGYMHSLFWWLRQGSISTI